LALVGAVIGESEGIAIFLDQGNSNQVVRLRIGEDYDGWVLHSVKGREAILQRDGEDAVFALPAPDDVSAPAVPNMQGNITTQPLASGAGAGLPPAGVPQGAVVYPRSPGDFAPYVPHGTPRNGEPDGL
jgi:general secretion pathway protein N